MAVKIGSARMDENGKATGGKAGDQTGIEVSTQDWYLSSKGWVLLRAKDPNQAKKIAEAMKSACANNKIGYDQAQRNTLFNQVKPYGFDPSKATLACETDCSALVRVCCHYAGIVVKDFITSDEASTLMATGKFDKLTDSKYITKSDYLKIGDILVTKTKGHTVVVLTDGPKAEISPEPVFGARDLKKGCLGSDVKELQTLLISWGFPCGPDKADGDFGNDTLLAVKKWQKANNLVIDGVINSDDFKKIEDIRNPIPPIQPEKYVKVVSGASVNIRTAPDANSTILGIAKLNDSFVYGGETKSDWYSIYYDKTYAWISSKYTALSAEAAPTPTKKTYGKIIDVSQYDTVDWDKVATIEGDNKIIFAVLRATSVNVDTKLKKNIEGCVRNNIPYGVYSYSYSKTNEENIAEVDRMFKAVKNAGGNPVAWYLDAEEGKNTTTGARAWLKRMKELVGDTYVGFYSMDSRCTGWKSTVEKFDGCWTARWNTPDIKPAYSNYHIWQHGFTKISGITPSGKTDSNRLYPGLSLEEMLATRAKT